MIEQLLIAAALAAGLVAVVALVALWRQAARIRRRLDQ